MNTIKIDKYFKGMVANKGLSGIETENTVFAFLAAANRTYYGIKCDVFVTKDDYIITTQDDTLLKLGLLNLYIPSFNYDDLRKFYLIDRKTSNLNENFYIPKFEDYLAICKAYRKHAFVNIWSNMKHEHLEKILADINQFHNLNEVSFMSANRKDLTYLKKTVENSKLYLVSEKPTEDDFDFCKKNGCNIYVKINHLNQNFIKRMHLLGLKVAAGVSDDKMQAEKFIKLDVDYIFTNILE